MGRRMPTSWQLLWLSCVAWLPSVAAGQLQTYSLGVLGPFTSADQRYLAAVAAFDIDFRKNHDTELRNRFGPPIVSIPDLDPDLRLSIKTGTSDGQRDIGLATSLAWLQQDAEASSSEVVGIVGGLDSKVTSRVSSLTTIYGVPQVSWGAAGKALSDKEVHTFFSRTVPTSGLQGRAVWAWMTYFSVPSISILYSLEDYGESIFGSASSLAVAASEPNRIRGVAIVHQPEAYDLSLAREACEATQSLGSRFILMAMGLVETNHVMYIMEDMGMLYTDDFQILGSDAVGYLPTAGYSPSNGLPIGMHKFTPKTRGPLHAHFVDLWRNMTVDDVYSNEAAQRLSLQSWQVPLSSATAQNLTTADFEVANAADLDKFMSFLFDACYVFAISVNNLLRQGRHPRRQALLEEIRNISFEGISGGVSFDSVGDRLLPAEVWSTLPGHGMVKFGDENLETGSLTILSDPVWAGGQQSRTLPSLLLTCLRSFVADEFTGECRPCPRGVGCGYSPSDGFPLGFFGPITSVTQSFLAEAIAFDLDFRKNFDPDLRARLGPPIVNISNLDPRLRVKLQIGTSHSDVGLAMNTALDWLQGNRGFSRVAALLGAYHSANSIATSPLSSVFKVPQVSWASMSEELSDKARHKYFMRTISPGGTGAKALWVWMRFYRFPSAALLHTRDGYGEGILSSVNEIAAETGEAYRIQAVGMPWQPFDFDLEVGTAAIRRIQGLGSRLVITALSAPELNSMLYVMERENTLETYQVLSHPCSYEPRNKYKPSGGFLPLGLWGTALQLRGPLFPKLADMWHKMTTEDLYSSAAVERYMLDRFHVPLASAVAPPMTDASFAEGSPSAVAGLIMDAGFAAVHGINNLLLLGHEPEEIHGELLLEAINKVDFEGASGRVRFDSNGDRITDTVFGNVQHGSQGGRVFLSSAQVDLVTGSFTELEEPVWANGVQSRMPPDSLMSCLFGFIEDAETQICEPCNSGIGCGYQASEGFPLGIFGPITSMSQDFLVAAVAFDLDFRKNFDEAVRARFGPPIINISDLDPRLRIKLQIGTSDSSSLVGMSTAMDWFLGAGDFSQVAGLIGGYDSDVTSGISSNAAVFEVPQVGWGATSTSLSDKSLHPYFVRTVPSDSLEGQAMWAWANYFNIPAMANFYIQESYGAGISQSLRNFAAAAGESQHIIDVGVAAQQDGGDALLSVFAAACASIRMSGSKVVVLAMENSNANVAMYVMEQEDMVDSYQILGSSNIAYLPTNTYKPSRGVPLGFQEFRPVARGPLFPKFAELWTKMLPEDVYGPEAVERFMLDHMRVPLSSAKAPPASTLTFANPQGADSLCTILFDAGYTFVMAINNLLKGGLEPTEIFGQVLMEEVKKTAFEGVSGAVTFDANGDRRASYELWNWQQAQQEATTPPTPPQAVMIALFSGETAAIAMPSTTATVHWAGGLISSTIPDTFMTCEPGRGWDQSSESCRLCSTGFFSIGGLRRACSPCQAGTTSMEGSTNCTACEPGTFSDNVGESCTACTVGTYGPTPGLAACLSCPVGRYSDAPGQVDCKRCGDGRPESHLWTTMASVQVNGATLYNHLLGSTSADVCVCDTGAHNRSGECIPCSEGMVCVGMGQVVIESGYYSDVDLSVYECHGDSDRCQGGLPGSTCAPGRTGITCAECEDDKTPGDGGACKDCEGTDTAPLVMVVLIYLACVGLVYVITDRHNRATQSHTWIACVIGVSQLISVGQLLSVVATLDLEWEEPAKSIMKVFKILVFDLEFLRLSCVGIASPLRIYLGKVSLILATITVMLIVHCVFVVARYRGKFRERMPSLVGSIGTSLMALYISVTTAVLQPFQCQSHPNGKWTMRSHESVVCWDAHDHKVMVAVGVIALVFVPIAFLVGCAWVTLQYPSRMKRGDSEFLKAFSFLFFRFKAKTYYYMSLLMVRSFFVAFVLVIPEVSIQVLSLQLILVLGYTVTLHTLPWRIASSNAIDCFIGVVTLILISVAALVVREEDRDRKTIAHLCLWFTIVAITPSFLAVGSGLQTLMLRFKKPFEFFLCHHKLGSGAFTRLLKMHLLMSGKLRRTAGVFIDVDNLDHLDSLFNHVGNDTYCLCVIGTSEIFTRPWCLGEMCTAMLKKVNTIVVAMTGFNLPDDNFIEGIAVSVDNLETLVQSGMNIEVLQETLRWIASVPSLRMPQTLSWSAMDKLVDQLCSSKKLVGCDDIMAISDSGARKTSSTVQDKKVLLVHDLYNLEAAAGSMVLQSMLNRHLGSQPEYLPALLDKATLPGSTRICLFMCTNGALDRPELLLLLLQAGKSTVNLVPILAESNFKVPSSAHLAKWELQPPQGLEADDVPKLMVVVTELFREIATNFLTATESVAVLEIKAGNIAERLVGFSLSSRQGAATDGTKRSSSSLGKVDLPMKTGSSTATPLTAIRTASTGPVSKAPSAHDTPSSRTAAVTANAASNWDMLL